VHFTSHNYTVSQLNPVYGCAVFSTFDPRLKTRGLTASVIVMCAQNELHPIFENLPPRNEIFVSLELFL